MRRSTLLAALAAPVFAPAVAVAQQLVQIRIASSPNADVIAILWGLENGAFRKAGLDVDLQRANSGSAVAAAVAGRAVDIGKSSMLSILTARAKDFPFVLVAPSGMYSAEVPTVGMVVAHDSPLKTAKDCNGKVVGVSSLNDLFSLGTQAWVDQNGGDAKTLRFLEIPSSAIGDALVAGRIDAGTLDDPQLGQALKSGKARLFCAPDSAIAHRFMDAAYFSIADYITKNKRLVAAFRHVVQETSNHANEHREQMIPLLANFTGIAANVIASTPQTFLATTLDVTLIQPLINVAANYKAIPVGFEARAMIDLDTP